MNKQYDNELSGALFKNDDMREGKKDPNYKGSVTVEGVEYWVSAWLNVAKSGQRFMSLKLKPKGEKPSAAPSAPPPADDFNDDIPF